MLSKSKREKSVIGENDGEVCSAVWRVVDHTLDRVVLADGYSHFDEF